MWDKAATDYYQRRIAQFQENIYIRLGQANHYAVDLDGLYDLFNDDVTDPFEGNEDPYTGLENILDVDEYVNNVTAITKWQIAYVPLEPVAEYIHMLNVNTILRVGWKHYLT